MMFDRVLWGILERGELLERRGSLYVSEIDWNAMIIFFCLLFALVPTIIQTSQISESELFAYKT